MIRRLLFVARWRPAGVGRPCRREAAPAVLRRHGVATRREVSHMGHRRPRRESQSSPSPTSRIRTSRREGSGKSRPTRTANGWLGWRNWQQGSRRGALQPVSSPSRARTRSPSRTSTSARSGSPAVSRTWRWSVNAATGADEAKKNAKNPKIRLFTVKKTAADTPRRPAGGQLQRQVAGGRARTPSAPSRRSAYFFGRDLQKALDVPVGIIHTSWGGTASEEWTSMKVLDAHPEHKGKHPRRRSCTTA